MNVLSKETFAYEPFGKEFLHKHHPCSQNKGSQDNEQWIVEDEENDLSSLYYKENEVYVKDSMAVWSSGSSHKNGKQVKKCFTVQTPVKQVQVTNFGTNGYSCDDVQSNRDLCLCILEEECLTLCSYGGSVYTNALPFKVKKIWRTFNGLCIERQPSDSEATDDQKGSIPTIFTLSHPLDDMRPMVYRAPDGKKCLFVTDATQHIVLTSINPPLIVTYDTIIGVHIVWKPRQTTEEDQPDPLNAPEGLPEFASFSFAQHSQILSDQSRLSLSPSLAKHVFSPLTLRHQPSPIRPASHQSSFQTSLINQTTITSSLSLQSPNVGSSHRIHSPHSAIAHESPRGEIPSLSQSVLKRLSSPFLRVSGSESVLEDLMFEPLPPNVCLDYVWQEVADTTRHGSKGMADKVFIVKDFVDITYLCLFVKHLRRLRLLKTSEDCLTYISWRDIAAKDAGALTGLKVLATITLENDVMLYSGDTPLCKLDIISSIERYGLAMPLKASVEDIGKKIPSPVSGLTEQISALSTCSELHDTIFSGDAAICEIRDFTRQYLTVVLSNGNMLRTKIPPLSGNSFVLQCMHVITEDLAENLALKVLSKFYCALNSKQSQTFVDVPEWIMLSDCALQLMGFPEFSRRLLQGVDSNSPSPPERKKPKKSQSLSGSEDWELLLESDEAMLLRRVSNCLGGANACSVVKERSSQVTEVRLTVSSLLYEYIPNIYVKLSHFYEELKLDIQSFASRQQLGRLLAFLSMFLGLEEEFSYFQTEARTEYILQKQQYHICKDQRVYLMTKLNRGKLQFIDRTLLKQLSMTEKVVLQYPENCKRTNAVCKVYSLLGELVENKQRGEMLSLTTWREQSSSAVKKIINYLLEAGFTRKTIGLLPNAIALPIIEVLHHSCLDEEGSLDVEQAKLLGREDVALLHEKNKADLRVSKGTQNGLTVDDGMAFDDEILKVMFSQDLRVEEVKRLLQSSAPVTITLTQKPEVSDYEFVREQEACLMVISKRTMALPIGRGMFTLGTSDPSMSETLTIPILEMTGKVLQSNKTVSLAQMDLPGDLLHWPSFHNGVAAGLKVASGSSHVNSTWIVYNKLKYTELTEEHAGFLMALGLTGHLSVLPLHQLHDYLIKGHDLTSVALLIGMAATRIGTMDSSLYKLLSLHIESLLPPTALELGIPHAAHVAAIVAIGLLFLGSCESHLVRVMLNEINRPPGPEMENAVDRESHALAAGIALGMIMLGKGTESPLYDIDIGHELYHYIVGGERRQMPNDMKEKYRVSSHLVKEENIINTDVTAPSAIIALALMYLKTNNRNVANWLKPSDTITLLETVKPDHLLLKVLARNLIMWDEIVPIQGWINAHLAEVFRKVEISHLSGVENLAKFTNELDIETVGQCHCCIIAGCCLSIGLKFAGSMNKDAFDTLLECTRHFKRQLASPMFEKTGHGVVEMCLINSLLSLAMVMSGSGNLEILRLTRQLHKRCTSEVTYGSHMAVHMAVGLLFLGGGRYTLTTSNLSIAALLCAVYPKFPNTSRDNRYHLQALRHLYVLACEPRLLVPRDIDTGNICYVPVDVTLKASEAYPEDTVKLLAPCFIPEQQFIKKISVIGPRYWPLTVVLDQKEIPKEEFLRIVSELYVKKKAGYLPYSEDPKGNKNLMARTFSGQTNQIDVIKSFTSDPLVIAFAEFCCQEMKANSQVNSEFYSKTLFDCVTGEKLDVLNIYLAIDQVVRKAETGEIDGVGFSQLAMILAYYENVYPVLQDLGLVGKPLLDEDFVAGIRLRLRETYHKKA